MLPMMLNQYNAKLNSCEALGYRKKFQETILFVPFFGAHANSLQRHMDLVAGLGFDSVTFELMDDWGAALTQIISSKGQLGLKHVWADQIENLLNSIPGKKIVYSFSNPTASAFEAIAHRNAWDISAMICDGGPSGQLTKSMLKFFSVEKPVPSLFLRMILAGVSANMWSPHYKTAISQDLDKFPKGFRLLSIRGWKDPLISPEMIDKVFEGHDQIDWEKLSIPEGKHLNGLKDFPEQYVPKVQSFLVENSHAI